MIDVARVDQFRASLREALATPCSCGECVADESLRSLLALDDAGLWRVIELLEALPET